MRGQADLVEELGDSTIVRVKLAGAGPVIAAKLQRHLRSGLQPPDPVGVRPLPGTGHLLDAAGRAAALRRGLRGPGR